MFKRLLAGSLALLATATMAFAQGAELAAPKDGKAHRIGIITYAAPGGAKLVKAALAELGYKEGENVVYEEKAGERDLEAMPRLAGELVEWKPDVILSLMTNAHIAIKEATKETQTPVVFWSAAPQETGIVKSFRSSGTNFTGFTYEPPAQVLQLRLLKLAMPDLKCVGHLYNPTYPPAIPTRQELEIAGKLMNVEVKVHETLSLDAFETSISAMRDEGCGGFVVGPHELFNGNAKTIAELASKYGLAAVSVQSSIPKAGGLAAYTPPFERGWPAMAFVIERILKGEKPADIPVERGFKSPLLINLKAAKELGIELPPTLIDEADELIE